MRELALHILDIVQNSVAAGATTVTIAVDEETDADRLTFSIADDGRGMDEETVEKVTDPFFTTRTTRKVGLGLPLLKETSTSCNGSFSIDSRVGEGTTVTAAYQRSHIDRPPLGDIASTMLVILLGNEDIDIRYSHRKDEQMFSFESGEMKEILDGLSFQNPDVYQWLKEFLADGEGSVNV
ncbi:MAG: ATP-binding protein [Peptococcaceae bacterium]|jgi:anti-sigma regulatory factor (Ser/Thr protein kinase)|nr:ATP-binding protein [Peptococcaceae bacterium]